MIEQKKYKVYTLKNFSQIPQLKSVLTQEQINAIEVVGNVLPFKVNNYVCLLYTSPSPRDMWTSRMPSSA